MILCIKSRRSHGLRRLFAALSPGWIRSVAEARYTLSRRKSGKVNLSAIVFTGDSMRHDWIFDVLNDLRAYALANNLPALAAKTEEALRTARIEIASASGDNGPQGGAPPVGRAH